MVGLHDLLGRHGVNNRTGKRTGKYFDEFSLIVVVATMNRLELGKLA